MVTRTQLYGAACAAIFLAMIIACLWPFAAPRNQVAWLARGNGVHFGDYGSIVSRGAVAPTTGATEDGWTVELWLRPARVDQSGELLTFYNPARASGFSLSQSGANLRAKVRAWRGQYDTESPEFDAAGVFRGRREILLTISSGPEGTSLYVDGNLVKVASRRRFSAADLTGEMVLANSPTEVDTWSGDLRGLALYYSDLAPAEVVSHYTDWIGEGRPEQHPGDDAAAVYSFDEGSGVVILNRISPGADLYIPDRFVELHAPFLERPWTEFQPDRGYVKDVIINIGGFVPLGFVLYAFLALCLHTRRSALKTIVAGTLFSLTVEILQAFLPTRNSGMTDIFTNTLGTAAGAGLCEWGSRVSEQFVESRFRAVRLLAGLLVRSERTWTRLLSDPELSGTRS
jgi:VanZ like family/Concanavalin A-like lectin/glucanases superfamily